MLTCEGRELPESLQKENLDKNLPKMIESLTYKYHDKSGFQIRPKIIAFDTETYSSNGDIMTPQQFADEVLELFKKRFDK